jgi:hypothetical protein
MLCRPAAPCALIVGDFGGLAVERLDVVDTLLNVRSFKRDLDCLGHLCGPFPLDTSGLPAAPEKRSITRVASPRLGQAELVSRHRDSLCASVRVWRRRAWTSLDSARTRCSEL